MTISSAPAPIRHTGANPITIDLQQLLGNSAEQWCEVCLQNLSHIAVAIDIAQDRHLLGPGQANVFPLRGKRSIRVTPQLVPGAAPGAVPVDAFELLLTVASQDDRIPGTFPAVVALEPAYGLGTLVIPDNVSPNAIDVGRPAGINYLRLNVFAGDVLTLTVTGDQTGTTYLKIIEPGAGSWFTGVAGCQITEAEDKSLTVSALLSAGHNASIRISGYASEDAAPVITRAQVAPALQLAAASTAGQPVVSGINDPSAFAPGASVLLVTQGGAGPWQLGVVKSAGGAGGDPSKLTLTQNLQTALAIGDLIVLVPPVVPLEAPPTSTLTNTVVNLPAGAAAAYQLLSANRNRRAVTVLANHGNGIVFITANATVFVNILLSLPPQGYWEMPQPILVTGLWGNTNAAGQGGNTVVNEYT